MSSEILIKFDDKVQVELLVEALVDAINLIDDKKKAEDYRDLKSHIVLKTRKYKLFQ